MSEVSKQTGGFETSFEAMKKIKNASIWDAISSSEPNPPATRQAPVAPAPPGEDDGASPLRILSALADGEPVVAIQLHERSKLPFMAFQHALTELIAGGFVARSDGHVRITVEGLAMLKEFALA
jgi:hypothetical protein